MHSEPSKDPLLSDVDVVYSKVTWRLIPLLFLCYVFNQMDKFNIGYAQLQMKPDLGFSDAVYGLGASMFFVGYVLFEVPSNVLLQRIGARKTVLRIMVLWGLVSAGTAFVRTPGEFYAARFFLGVFEAGFLPGVVYYLTFWYPAERRARIVALFMMAIAVSGVIAGPISGWIIENLNGYALRGWQWMYVIEGLPAAILGVVFFFWLSDSPADAGWLTADERQIIAAEAGGEVRNARPSLSLQLAALRDPKVYCFAFIYFAISCGAYTLAFWTPSMIHALGIPNPQLIGLYAVAPTLTAALVMVFYGKHSDKTKERRWHFMGAVLVSSSALALTTFTGGIVWLSMILLSMASAGVIASYPVFWAEVTPRMTRVTAGAGIAAISSLGGLSGVVCPYAIGLIKTSTGSLSIGLYFVAGVMVLGGVAMLREGRLHEGPVVTDSLAELSGDAYLGKRAS